MILVVDNYDSFTFNLVQAIGSLGAHVEVRRNDAIDIDGVRELAPSGIVLSPGPGRPEDAGICMALVSEIGPTTPMLGVCLGHQAIGIAFGACVDRAPEIVHGKTASVSHDATGVFTELPNPFVATRYHSLVVRPDSIPISVPSSIPDSSPAPLLVNATTSDGLVMGMRHATYPIHGVQFHPESIACPDGPLLLQNFLRLTQADVDGDTARIPRS